MYQILNAIAHGVVGTVLIAIWFVPLFKITICDNFGNEIKTKRLPLAFLMLLKSVCPKSKVSFIWKGYKRHEKRR